jgi:hypothetical protein
LIKNYNTLTPFLFTVFDLSMLLIAGRTKGFRGPGLHRSGINEESFEIVLTLFLHSLIMLLHRNFNCRFHYVQGLAPLINFSKIVPLFLLIFERKPEKKLIRGGGQMIF